MQAIISDIHANSDALIAVLKDIETQKVRSVICLGDIVGYGPCGGACIDFVMQNASCTLMGNHDHAMVHRPLGRNPIAAEMMLLSQGMPVSPPRITPGAFDPAAVPAYPCGRCGKELQCLRLEHARDSGWELIANLSETFQEGKFTYLHGSPSDPVFGYLFPDRFRTGWQPAYLAKQFSAFDGIVFCGHTHIPCIITDTLACVYPSDYSKWFEFDTGRKYIVNVGSIGQPRDGDARACYSLFDESVPAMQWRRIPYDVAAAIEKTTALCGEHTWCAARLALGK